MEVIRWDGRQISKPGIYSHIPLPTYHLGNICVGPSVSSSGLRVFNPLSRKGRSPAHFWAQSPLNPKRKKEVKEPKYFILGRALHHIILGEPIFTKLFVQQPGTIKEGAKEYEWNNNRTKCIEWNNTQRGLGRTILTLEQIEKIREMSIKLSQCHEVRAGILNGLIEHSMFWIDPETKLWIKVRPDTIPTSLQFADIKIIGKSVMWWDMQTAIEEYGYYQQAALVREGCRRLFGEEMQMFTYVFVESEDPYCVAPVEMKELALDQGEQVNRRALRIIAKCLKSGKWPGPYDDDGIRPIDLRDRATELVKSWIQTGETA